MEHQRIIFTSYSPSPSLSGCSVITQPLLYKPQGGHGGIYQSYKNQYVQHLSSKSATWFVFRFGFLWWASADPGNRETGYSNVLAFIWLPFHKIKICKVELSWREVSESVVDKQNEGWENIQLAAWAARPRRRRWRPGQSNQCCKTKHRPAVRVPMPNHMPMPHNF